MIKIKVILVFVFSANLIYSQNPIIIAHRGASAYAPENTLSAFERAIEMHAFMIEADIHQTKDSILVIMHDESVDRTTNGTGLIKDMLFADFKKLIINSPLSKIQESPPSLEEALKLINGRCKLLIELKRGGDYYPGIEARVAKLIKTGKTESYANTIHSFYKQALLNVAKADSTIKLQKLIVFNLPFTNISFDKHLMHDNFKNWDGVNIYRMFCSRLFIRKIHRHGKTIYVWTVNDSRKAKRYKRRGVDGIISNYPDILEGKQ